MKILNLFQNTPIPRTEAFTLDEYQRAAFDLIKEHDYPELGLLVKIKEHEGVSPDYYALPSVYGNSGATVGLGVDLGQHNEGVLQGLGVPETIINKVQPLFGVKNDQGENAVQDAIAKASKLSADEIEVLNKAFIRENSQALINALGPSLENIDPVLFANLASARYRGSLKENHKTFKLIKDGKYDAAADEFLNHEEYKSLKSSNPNSGVVKRMEGIASSIRSHGYKRGGVVRDVYGRSYI